MKLKDKFRQLKKAHRKAFIVYIPYGFPDIKKSGDIFLALQEAGVDIIELGLPFSDPLADGPIIQEATTLALKKGANVDNFFKTFGRLKTAIEIPVVVMSYYNPLMQFGTEQFFRKMQKLEFQAVTLVDVPLEESSSYLKQARTFGIDTVFFVTPVTSDERVNKIAKASRGFIYYISVTGITGPKDLKLPVLRSHIRSIKKITDLPVCVGFGIHNRAQVAQINKFSDGVIIGSEVVRFISRNHHRRDFLAKLKNHVRFLKG